MAFYERIVSRSDTLPSGITVSGMFVVASLEIAVSDGDDAGLTLRLHSYPSDARREGYWAPPNVQRRLEIADVPQRIDRILSRFDKYVAENSESMRTDLKNLAESFGLRETVVQRLEEDPIFEIKPSINEPTVINAYYTVRFALTEVNEDSEANLVDRESRHGFVVLPLKGLSLISSVRQRTDPHGTGKPTRYYLGKPIISGLQQVIEQPETVERILQRAIDVSRVETRRSEVGIIAVADVAGYGRALSSGFLALMSDPESERRSYQARVLGVLELALTATGTTQVQTAGDGFLAGYPSNGLDDAREMLFDVIENWSDTIRMITDEINGALSRANNTVRLGSRIALSLGAYEWGRINGFGSFSPAFNGPAVVDTARLEQGLNAYVRERVRSGHMKGDEHMLALDPTLADGFGGTFDRLTTTGWTDLGDVTLQAKERVISQARLFEWRESV